MLFFSVYACMQPCCCLFHLPANLALLHAPGQVNIPLWALVHLPVVVTVTTAAFTPGVRGAIILQSAPHCQHSLKHIDRALQSDASEEEACAPRVCHAACAGLAAQHPVRAV